MGSIEEFWKLSPRLYMPEMRPLALLSAIFETNPIEEFLKIYVEIKNRINDEIKQNDNHTIAIAWNSVFRTIPGDKVILLEDYEPKMIDHVNTTNEYSATYHAILISSNRFSERNWFATKTMNYQNKAYIWNIEFRPQKNELIKMILDESNMEELKKIVT